MSKSKKISFHKELKSIKGEPLYISELKNGQFETTTEVMKLGDAAVDCLMAQAQDDKPTGVEKTRRFTLAQKIMAAMKAKRPLEVDDEELKTLRGQMEKFATTVVYGQFNQMISEKE